MDRLFDLVDKRGLAFNTFKTYERPQTGYGNVKHNAEILNENVSHVNGEERSNGDKDRLDAHIQRLVKHNPHRRGNEGGATEGRVNTATEECSTDDALSTENPPHHNSSSQIKTSPMRTRRRREKKLDDTLRPVTAPIMNTTRQGLSNKQQSHRLGMHLERGTKLGLWQARRLGDQVEERALHSQAERCCTPPLKRNTLVHAHSSLNRSKYSGQETAYQVVGGGTQFPRDPPSSRIHPREGYRLPLSLLSHAQPCVLCFDTLLQYFKSSNRHVNTHMHSAYIDTDPLVAMFVKWDTKIIQEGKYSKSVLDEKSQKKIQFQQNTSITVANDYIDMYNTSTDGYASKGVHGSFVPLPYRNTLEKYGIESCTDNRAGPIVWDDIPYLRCKVCVITQFEITQGMYEWTLGVHGLALSFTDSVGKVRCGYVLPESIDLAGWSKSEALDELLLQCGWGGGMDAAEKLSLVNLQLARFTVVNYSMTFEEYCTHTKKRDA